jgi:hypothetical protein
MPKYNLILQEEAILDLLEAFNYYESKKMGLGNEFEAEAFELLELIESNPYLFQIRFGNFHETPLNKFPYNIVYEILKDDILINAVFFTKRHPANKNRNGK